MHKINNIVPDENEFLQIIGTIDDSVKRLCYKGTLPETRLPAVAIVGTRKPSAYGKEVAYKLAHELASKGVVIISGLAIGTDGIAHRAALDAKGTTIAVLPTSLTAVYPSVHRKLADEIVAQGGALITEYGPDDRIFKGNFLARNRIVSGLSDGVLIIEAAGRSGTLATANFALHQGKSVMAIPGNITNPMSEGCNKLIRQGATPITSTADVLQELGLSSKQAQTALPLASSPEEQAILRLMQAGEREGEAIQKQSGLEPALFSQTLTMLELEGKIRALGANRWTIS